MFIIQKCIVLMEIRLIFDKQRHKKLIRDENGLLQWTPPIGRIPKCAINCCRKHSAIAIRLRCPIYPQNKYLTLYLSFSKLDC